MSYLDGRDKLRRQLEGLHPGWQVWYVPLAGQQASTWCARSGGRLLNEGSAEALSAAIEAAGVQR